MTPESIGDLIWSPFIALSLKVCPAIFQPLNIQLTHSSSSAYVQKFASFFLQQGIIHVQCLTVAQWLDSATPLLKRSLADFLTPSDKTSVPCSRPLSKKPYNTRSFARKKFENTIWTEHWWIKQVLLSSVKSIWNSRLALWKRTLVFFSVWRAH